jgi:hypothetical protein
LKAFDFAAKLKAIDHWTKERERRVSGVPASSEDKELSHGSDTNHVDPAARRVSPTRETQEAGLLGVKVRMAEGSLVSTEATPEMSRR